MSTTPDLIEALAARAAPVRRAWPPLARAAVWLGLACAIIAALAAVLGTRADLAVRLTQFSYCAGFAAALLTGAAAALAAFQLSLPDRSRLWLLLPVPSAAIWFATVGYGCLAHWVPIDSVPLDPAEGPRCLRTLLLSFAPLSVAMFWMLRRSARLRPRAAVLAGSVAAGALTACALTLLHQYDASAIVLLWNFGAAGLVVAVDAMVGSVVLRPVSPSAG